MANKTERAYFFKEKIVSAVKKIKTRQPMVGCHKLQKMLEHKSLVIGRGNLFEILRVDKLLIRTKRKVQDNLSGFRFSLKY